MNKLISIIIPTYNMEKLLPRCLDSLLISEGLERLEVWIVNDGSKDRSSDIGHQYEAKYPGVFNVIDKMNGNYGSCINAALPKCTGKYVKILDADDTFNTENLRQLVKDLSEVDVDLFITNFQTIRPSGILSVKSFEIPSNHIFTVEQKYSSKYKGMHQIAYRTKIFQDIKYQQTEGISYTDNEWAFYPMFVVKNYIYFDYDIYQYHVGREGQTMDYNVLRKSTSQFHHIGTKMLEYYIGFDRQPLPGGIKAYLPIFLQDVMKNIYYGYLLFNPITKDTKKLLEDFDVLVRKAELGEYADGITVSIFRQKVKFVKVYRQHKFMTFKLIKVLCDVRSKLKKL